MKRINYKDTLIKRYKLIKDGKDSERFVVEGLWAYEKLVASNTLIESLILCSERKSNDKCHHLIQISKDVYEVSRKTMDRLSSKAGQTDLVMICKKNTSTGPLKKILVLDGLESPGNIGTIFRSCDGAGFDGIFIVNPKARINQYKVVKASMGGYFNIPHKSFESVKALAAYLIDHNFKILLANPSDKSQKNKLDKLALVVGNERYGLSKEWFDYHHQTVSIPMKGFCDSLNVGVAASILMYEIIKGVQ